ncbi:putative deoxyribonuclease TATDN2 [Mya arenaria]|uniref:putative deoxyribonuclease TATDN2 n=1 Tax=Mya arenaria TaxID=6604 RepID=UPI0022E6DE7F|nr:putative deoxyribonuclease TATDN2 [Mya arenaria]
MQLSRTPDLQSLVNFINLAGQIRADEIQINNRSKASVLALCDALEVPCPEVLSLSPISTPGLLLHWRAQIVICSLLNQSKMEDMMKAFPAVECLEVPMAWDSHFHADCTAERAKMGIDDLQALVDSAPCIPSLKVKVTGGVAVFCDVNSYPTQLDVDRLRQQGVVVAVGIPPKHAAKLTEKDWSAFEAALALSGVSALGEVGLDYTSQPSTWGIQHSVLRRALEYLRPDHVLVLHNRPDKRNSGDDMLQLLFQLKGCIPTEQRIHLHCFSGSQYAVDQWSRHFPNTHFGYTTSFLSYGESAIQALRNMDESRYLLETDSPYFGNTKASHTTPGHLGSIANAVSKVRHAPWQDVLKTANSNGRRLYAVS